MKRAILFSIFSSSPVLPIQRVKSGAGLGSWEAESGNNGPLNVDRGSVTGCNVEVWLAEWGAVMAIPIVTDVVARGSSGIENVCPLWNSGEGAGRKLKEEDCFSVPHGYNKPWGEEPYGGSLVCLITVEEISIYCHLLWAYGSPAYHSRDVWWRQLLTLLVRKQREGQRRRM